MKEIDKDSIYASVHDWRFKKTFNFLKNYVDTSEHILDLGPINPLSYLMEKNGYKVTNSPPGIDLDLNFEIVKNKDFKILTAFEILEHLVSPFPLLKETKAEKLIASVPLKLWFANAYWNKDDPFDRHYHEFEPKQFDMLLEKAGWQIIHSEQWIDETKQSLGFRPLLRKITPRFYIVYCERKSV